MLMCLLQIVLRLSKLDDKEPGKRRHFEISIDSPFHLLSCNATQANIYLPAYTSPNTDPVTPVQEHECGCPGAPLVPRSSSSSQTSIVDAGVPVNPVNTVPGRAPSRSFTNGSGGLARPAQAHLASDPHEGNPRPMHLLRAPSFAPPAFEDIPPPPPLVTPPPDYTSIVSEQDRETVLEDYFSRTTYEDHDDDDARGSGRVDVPLTPGGRINRSMDVSRDWVRLDDSIVQ